MIFFIYLIYKIVLSRQNVLLDPLKIGKREREREETTRSIGSSQYCMYYDFSISNVPLITIKFTR